MFVIIHHLCDYDDDDDADEERDDNKYTPLLIFI
jgi:hypothetical protein